MLSLTNSESSELRIVVGRIVPMSEQYGLPGADDALIFRDIEQSLGRDISAVRRGLAAIGELAKGSLESLPQTAQDAVLRVFKEKHADLALVLNAVTVQCYYRDDRVMQSLGMELRSPFPKGFKLSEGDKSLLQPVIERGRIFRECD